MKGVARAAIQKKEVTRHAVLDDRCCTVDEIIENELLKKKTGVCLEEMFGLGPPDL
jgi:hypothetical protein